MLEQVTSRALLEVSPIHIDRLLNDLLGVQGLGMLIKNIRYPYSPIRMGMKCRVAQKPTTVIMSKYV